jgi:hypothetical protein
MTFARVVPKTQPAHAKTPVKRARAAAQRAAVVFADFEFVRQFGLYAQTLLSQSSSLPVRFRMIFLSAQSKGFQRRVARGSANGGVLSLYVDVKPIERNEAYESFSLA